MKPREALDHLKATLTRFENAVGSGEQALDLDVISAACQNFRWSVQNLDAQEAEEAADVGERTLLKGDLKNTELEALKKRLDNAIQTVAREREEVRDEIRTISRGRAALRGYKTLRSHTSSQFVSVSR